MDRIKDQILELAAQLSPEDLRELAQRFNEAADDQDGSLDELDAEWADEIQRRIDEVRSGKAKTKPWTEVMDEMERRARERSQTPST